MTEARVSTGVEFFALERRMQRPVGHNLEAAVEEEEEEEVEEGWMPRERTAPSRLRFYCIAGALTGAASLALFLIVLRASLGSSGNVPAPPAAAANSSAPRGPPLPHDAPSLWPASPHWAPAPPPPLPLVTRCTDSLVEYHAWLTAWFTGVAPRTAIETVDAGMSLAPSVVLVVPTGEAYGHAEMLEMLSAHYAEEPPGSTHRPDLGSIVVHRADADEVELTFNELQTQPLPGDTWQRCVLTTTAICEAQPSAGSGVAWRSFVERAELPCSTGHGREGA